MNKTEDINKLIAKHLTGEPLNSLEQNRLQEWIRSHQEEFNTLSTMINSINPEGNTLNIDTALAWKRLDAALKDQEPRLLSRKLVSIFLAAACIVIVFGWALWHQTEKTEILKFTGRAECVSKILLPDSSEVTLFPHASLVYTAGKSRGERRAELTGKAFFHVSKNPERAFIVETPSLTVEVLGTSFLVDANLSKKPSVLVKSGRVKVNAERQECILINNQRVQLDDDGVLRKDTVTEASFLTQANPSFRRSFKHETLKNVIKEVELFFNVQIELQAGLESNLITTTFRNDELKDILKELAYLCNATYEKKGERTYILLTQKKQ